MASNLGTNLRTNWMIAIALIGWLMWLLAPVLTPFIAAALLAYIADPMADRLQRLKIPRTIAVVLVFLLTFIGVGLLVLLILPLVQKQVSALLAALPGIIAEAEQVWFPRVTEFLGVESGDDIGFGAFIARYSDMAGSWASTIFLSLTHSGGALAAAVISRFLIPVKSSPKSKSFSIRSIFASSTKDGILLFNLGFSTLSMGLDSRCPSLIRYLQ